MLSGIARPGADDGVRPCFWRRGPPLLYRRPRTPTSVPAAPGKRGGRGLVLRGGQIRIVPEGGVQAGVLGVRVNWMCSRRWFPSQSSKTVCIDYAPGKDWIRNKLTIYTAVILSEAKDLNAPCDRSSDEILRRCAPKNDLSPFLFNRCHQDRCHFGEAAPKAPECWGWSCVQYRRKGGGEGCDRPGVERVGWFVSSRSRLRC
jgi:hypothetical protein